MKPCHMLSDHNNMICLYCTVCKLQTAVWDSISVSLLHNLLNIMGRLPVCIIYHRIHFKTCFGKCYKSTVLMLINWSSSFGCTEKCDFAQVIERNSLYCASGEQKKHNIIGCWFSGLCRVETIRKGSYFRLYPQLVTKVCVTDYYIYPRQSRALP